MIPYEEQWIPTPARFRDADGCRVFPGHAGWCSDNDIGADARTLHIPLRLGVVDQFELAWDCHVLEEDYDLEEEEKELVDLLADPLVRDLAQLVLDGFPSHGGELAFEVEA